MRLTCLWAMLLLVGELVAADVSKVTHWDFEDGQLEKLPKGWTPARTGEGEGSVWKVFEDDSSPKGSKVLAQTAAGSGPLFNLCIADGTSFQNGEITVSLKAVTGKKDQGGGLVWRLIDANNYYIARLNPLEDNYRLYKVVSGKRAQLATKNVKAGTGEWHTITVRQTSGNIQCLLNGKQELEAKDDTFDKPGRIGLWTKADAQTYFDDLVVSPR